jgi:hypothetical protein
MILSFVCGVVISKYVKAWRISILIAVLVGTFIGVLGAIGVFGVAYPFYIAVDPDVVSVPEIVPFAVFFFVPQIKVYTFSSGWLSGAVPLVPLVIALFVTTSIIIVIFGDYAGKRWFWKNKFLERMGPF